MTTITLSEIKAAQDHLASLIAQFEASVSAPAVPPTILVREAQIELQPGEVYAGLVLDDAGQPSHHLILLPGKADDITWEDAKTWAADTAGGDLPTRRELSLLYANAKQHFEEAWHWSSEQFAGRYAWVQYIYHGDQYYDDKSAELRARAVRRFKA